MKCGTTSLHQYLGKHPDIHVTEPKELHFFTPAKFNENKMDGYLKHFVSDKKIAGSSPQSYTKFHREDLTGVPERLHQYFPDIKLIYIVRNPIDRIHSHYAEAQEGGYAPSNGLNAFLKEDLKGNHYVRTSMYGYQISQYLKYFDKSQVLIVSSKDLKENRLNTLNCVFNFLGVDDINNERIFEFEANAGLNKRRKNELGKILQTPFLKKIRALIPSNLKQKIKESNVLNTNVVKESIDEYLLKELRLIFENDRIELENMIGQKINF